MTDDLVDALIEILSLLITDLLRWLASFFF